MRRLQVKPKLLKPVLIAVGIHLGLFSLLFISYTKQHELPEARPIIKARIYQLESQNLAEKHTAQKIAGDAEKTAAKQHEQEQLEQKRQRELKQKQEQERQAAAKAAEQKRQAEAAAAAKRKQEQQKAEAAKQLAAKKAAEQKAAAEKAAADKKKREQELAAQKKKQAELAAKKAAEAKQAEQERRRAEEEKQAAALAEMLSEQTRYQREMADKQAAEDIGRLNDLIIDLISSHWIRPAGTRNGMLVEVMVEFLPDGSIKSANISKSSGYPAYDNSAVAAIRSVGRVREMQNLDRASYERTYKQIRMAFRPEDLGP